MAVCSPSGEWRWVRLVEVEAYASFEAASHTHRGPTPRNQVMYGPAGHLYVYFSYGMHWCANVVTGAVGSGQAVLLRAGEPLGGVADMRAARGDVSDRDLCRGPARLAQALGLTGVDNGASVVGPLSARLGSARLGSLRIAFFDDGVPPPDSPGMGPRIGITKAAQLPWRWWVEGSPWVSGFRTGSQRVDRGHTKV